MHASPRQTAPTATFLLRERGATISQSYWLEMYKQKNSSGVNVSVNLRTSDGGTASQRVTEPSR